MEAFIPIVLVIYTFAVLCALYMILETFYEELYIRRITLFSKSARIGYFYDGEYGFNENFMTIIRKNKEGKIYAYRHDQHSIGKIDFISDNEAHYCGYYKWSYTMPIGFNKRK